MLFDTNQINLLSEIQSWPQFSTLKSRLEKYEKQLNDLEAAKADLAKKEAAIKAEFGHGLTFGFK